MKNIYKLPFLALLALTACNQGNGDNLKIIAPTGAPAFAFYAHANSANFETNDKPNNIVALMTEASDKDIVVIDTTSGLSAIENGAPYKIAATITHGNFYLVGTGKDENKTLDVGDTIVLFGQNKIPDKMFHYVYGNIYDEHVEYVPAVTDAATCLAGGKNLATGSEVDYVFIAQPAIYNLEAKKGQPFETKINIQELYYEKSNNLPIMQASVFVKDTVNPADAKDFLKDLEEDILDAIEDPELLEINIDSLGESAAKKFGATGTIARAVTEQNNALGLGYSDALENKAAIDNFISLFDMEATSEEIYFK